MEESELPDLESFVRADLLEHSVFEPSAIGSGAPLVLAWIDPPMSLIARDILSALQRATKAQGITTTMLRSAAPPSAKLGASSSDDAWLDAGLHQWFDFILGRPFAIRIATATSRSVSTIDELIVGAHGVVVVCDARVERLSASLELVESTRHTLRDAGQEAKPLVCAAIHSDAPECVSLDTLRELFGTDDAVLPVRHPEVDVKATLAVLMALLRKGNLATPAAGPR